MHIAGDAQSSREHYDIEQGSDSVGRQRWKYLRTARVADRMTSSITVVSPETRLTEALHLFTTMHIKAVAVYDGKEYVGLIGYASLTEFMGGHVHHAHSVRVRDIMDMRDIRIDPSSPDELLSEAWARMRQSGQTALPVLDVQGKLAGVLSAPRTDEHVSRHELQDAWRESIPRRSASDN